MFPARPLLNRMFSCVVLFWACVQAVVVVVLMFTFERERERQYEWGRAERDRETQNPKQAPGSEHRA